MPQLLTQAETCEITRKSSSTLRRDIAAGKFPAPLKIGARRIAWRAEDVQRWLDGLNEVTPQSERE